MNSLLKPAITIQIAATPPQALSCSFMGPNFAPDGRDPDFDGWLAQHQPGGIPGTMTAWEPSGPVKLRQMAQAILNTDATDLPVLCGGLIHGGHTVVPSQMDDLMDRTDRGQDVGLWVKRMGVYFFVRTERPDNGGIGLAILQTDKEGRWRAALSTCGLTSIVARAGLFFSRTH